MFRNRGLQRILFTVILILSLAPPAFAAAEVQKALSTVGAPLSTKTVSFGSNVTGGNRVVCVAVFGASEPDLADLSCSDATNGTYTDDVVNSDAFTTTFIASKCGVTGGFTDVTFTNTGTTGNGYVSVYEVSGTGCSTAQTGSQDNTSDTNHECASSGLSGTGAAFCGCQLGTGNAPAAAGSWTEYASGDDSRFFQYQYGTLSSDQGPFTTTAADSGAAAMVFYPDEGNGARLLLGVGE